MKKIVLVDDERWVRAAIRQTIGRTGLPLVVCHECSNGLEALNWLKNNQADLIIADIQMPVLDGLTFLEKLRSTGQETSVIMISGYDDFSYIQASLRAGVFDYLLKPVEVEEMKGTLEKWLNQCAGLVKQDKPKPIADPLEKSPVEQVLEFIKSKLPGEVTLTEAAEVVHLNPSYLSQLFKQRMNQTFLDYVLQSRMDEAERLLTHTTLSITEIAYRLGYMDLSYFSNSFKRIKRITPSQFRKAFQDPRISG
ncbi:response regulator transcription factor [Neobacillus dielmonensis]|uniref:response regulator transcription factor n=1 Tax=Neobacillus dielmonensis TaxID=1347369 RepID=UPI0005A681A8|nr:response regulator [Neobacillus dielmonensis]